MDVYPACAASMRGSSFKAWCTRGCSQWPGCPVALSGGHTATVQVLLEWGTTLPASAPASASSLQSAGSRHELARRRKAVQEADAAANKQLLLAESQVRQQEAEQRRVTARGVAKGQQQAGVAQGMALPPGAKAKRPQWRL